MKRSLLGGAPLDAYLADHHAGAMFGCELARRVSSENAGTPHGDFLEDLAKQLEEDREELEAIMGRLGAASNPLKDAAAWAGEKVGRLKLNGSLVGYSPVSRLLELEGLIGGVSAKLALWRALKERAAEDSRLDVERLDHMADRAQRQLQGLRAHHRRAAREALAGG